MTTADKSSRGLLAAAAGGFALGYGLSVIGGAVGAIDHALDASGFGLGLAVAAALLGSVLGFRAAERLSGRWLAYVAGGLFVGSAIGSSTASTIGELAGWRFGSGLAVGVLAGVAWLRGRSGFVQPIGLLLGVLTALLVDYLLAAAAGGAVERFWFDVPAWRWMFLTLVVPASLGSALVCGLVRAPRGQGVRA